MPSLLGASRASALAAGQPVADQARSCSALSELNVLVALKLALEYVWSCGKGAHGPRLRPLHQKLCCTD